MSPYNLSLKVTSPRFSSVLGGQCSASIDLLICLKKTAHCLGIFIYNLVGSRGTKQINHSITQMLIKRRVPHRQPIHLPPINPEFNPPKSYQTLDAAINLSTIEDDSRSPSWYLDIFKQFERDFNSNRLQTEFDRMLDETLNTRDHGEMNDMPQSQLIKQISKEIKMKLFQQYAKRRKSQPSRVKKSLKQREVSLYEKGSKSRLEISTLSAEKLKAQRSLEKIASNRIFGIQSTIHQLQERSKKGLSRRLRNYRLYPQLINPLLFVNI